MERLSNENSPPRAKEDAGRANTHRAQPPRGDGATDELRRRKAPPLTALCGSCSRPADLRLCPGCVDQLKSELRAVPWLARQLEVTLTRQARIGERNGPRSTETPLPFHVAAATDLESLTDELHMIAKTVAEHRGITVDAAPEPIELSRWLLRWVGEVVRHDDAADFLNGIVSLTRAGRRTIDLAPDRRFLGPCDECGEELYCWSSNGHLPTIVYCPGEECDAKYPMAERRAYLLEAAYDRLLTAAEMTQAIGELVPGQTKRLNASTIRTWASRGLRGRVLTPFLAHPKDPHQRTRYRVGEVLEFARRDMGVDDNPG